MYSISKRDPLIPAVESQRPVCGLCGERPCRTHGLRKSGKVFFKSLCYPCWREQNAAAYSHVKLYLQQLKKRNVAYRKMWKKPHLRHRGETCEECGFVPKHIAQLEVDHVDGNHSNNAPENLRTLCANCHRLKTMMERGLYQEDEPLMVVGV